jgi:hypothetical protein
MIVAVQAWKLIAPATLIDPNGFPATARSWIQLLAYILLTAAALNLYRHPRMRTGPVARVGGAVTFAGTALVAGDAWFEAVMYPMAVTHDPTLPSASPTTPWLIGILVSFGTFAIGWCATGVLLARSRLVTPAAGWLLMVAALLAYLPLMTPLAVPLGGALILCSLTGKSLDLAPGDDNGGPSGSRKAGGPAPDKKSGGAGPQAHDGRCLRSPTMRRSS